MKQGVLIYNDESSHIDIQFGLDDYYGGLHCGTTMDVLVNDEWIPTRIEKSDDWYLIGLSHYRLLGLTVRI